MLEGLKVQIGGPHVERIDQHFLQEFDNRRIFDLGRGFFGLRRGVGIRYFFIEFKIAADDAFKRFRCGRTGSVDHPGELVVFSNHPVHAQLGRKLYFFCRLMIRRISGCHHQPVIALAQHNNAIGLANLGVQQALGQTLNVDGVQIKQGRGESGGHEVRQVERRDGTRTGQFGDEAVAAAFCLAENFFCSPLPQLASNNQRPAQTRQCRGNRSGIFGDGIHSGHDSLGGA